MRADFWTKSPQQKLSDIGPKGSKKVKNCTKLVYFFTRDGRLRPKSTLFTLFGHYFTNTHSRHYVPLTATANFKFLYSLYHISSKDEALRNYIHCPTKSIRTPPKSGTIGITTFNDIIRNSL